MEPEKNRVSKQAMPSMQAMPEQMKKVNGELVIGKRANADLKQQYFARLLNVRRDTSVEIPAIPVSSTADIYCDSPIFEVSLKAIEQLKANRAPGVCSSLAELSRWGVLGIKQWLHEIIDGVWHSGQAPEDWKKVLLTIVPVSKSEHDLLGIICIEMHFF